MAGLARPLDTLLSRLYPTFGERVRTDPEALARAAGDESGLPPVTPSAVAFPTSAAEVVLIAREAAELGVAVVPRGAGTGKAGACIPQGAELVVDLSRMNRLLELRPQDLYAVVEPGLVNCELDRAAAEHGFMYPPDPASRESCSIGGNISTNAGGPRAVKYGVTQRYVWGVELVLMGGDVVRTGRRSIKGVAGYDLTSLIVGSEGTLGFVTQATMHIIPAPPAVETAWLSFSDPLTASRASERIFAAGIVPRMLELLDRTALDVVRPKSGFRIPEAGAALLVETDGTDSAARQELLRLCEIALEHGGTGSAVAENERDREAMRRARRLVSGSLKELYPWKISDDVAVPRSRMPELLTAAHEEGEAGAIKTAAYGHLGDGNVHINLLAKDASEHARAQMVRQRVLARAVALGGTITGEHGIGIAKRHELALEQSPETLALERRIKLTFDPQNLLNPGKALP